MRTRTRNFILVILAVVVLLLALGAVPGLLKSGDPYRLTATPVGEWTGPNGTAGSGANATAGDSATATVGGNATADNRTAINASALSEKRYPYTTSALAAASANQSGQSDRYWKGPTGFKEVFTHSPFDEMEALGNQDADAVTDEGVYVHTNRTVYLLAVQQEES